MAFEPLDLLEVLAKHSVEFVLIGGIAAAARGSPTTTVDLDVCYRRTVGNLRRLATALRSVDARLRGVSEDVPFLLEAETLSAGDHFTLSTSLGDLDLLGTPAGTAGFDELVRGATDVDLDGLTVKVASLDDLIRMKKAAGRPKDRVELEILAALRDELSARSESDSDPHDPG
ncbi:MAG: hypothetical protein ACRDJV_00875 [Actinomycetota bacterium]